MNFLSGSLRIGRLFGIDVRMHVLFIFYVLWRLYEWRDEAAFAAGYLAILFGSVLLHEFGHCFGARSVGGDARDILMWPLGGLAYAYAPMRPWPQFVTVACGPLVNVIFCVVSGAVVFGYTGSLNYILLNPFAGIHLPRGLSWIEATWIFYQINLLLLAFNLLPIYPLDGGQLFQAIIWPFVGLRRATLIACQVGIVGCVIFGVLSLSQSGGMLLFIAIFGGMTCWQRFQAARQGWLVEDTAFAVRNPRGGFWSRLFKARRHARPPAAPIEFPHPTPNPNPGAWQVRQDERAQDDAELDRILKKVSEHGIQSLSYVERQTLERITHERQSTR